MPGHLQWVEAANTYLAHRLLFEAFRWLPWRHEVREHVEYHNAARLLRLPTASPA